MTSTHHLGGWVGGGGSSCRMLIIRNGNVAVLILRISCVALSILRKSHVDFKGLHPSPTISTHHLGIVHPTYDFHTSPTTSTHHLRLPHTTHDFHTPLTTSTHHSRLPHITNDFHTLCHCLPMSPTACHVGKDVVTVATTLLPWVFCRFYRGFYQHTTSLTDSQRL